MVLFQHSTIVLGPMAVNVSFLDDYSCYGISLKLCTNMNVEDVTDTLDLALQASAVIRFMSFTSRVC
jgi:hypothetical protein